MAAALVAAPLVGGAFAPAFAADSPAPTCTPAAAATLASANFDDQKLDGLQQDGNPTSLTYENVDGDASNFSLRVNGRSDNYFGVQTPALSTLKPGDTISLSAKVRLAGATTSTAGIRLVATSKLTTGGSAKYDWVGNATVSASGWTTLSGTYTVPADDDTSTLKVYVGTDALSDGTATFDYYVDDFSVTTPAVTCDTTPTVTTVLSNDFESTIAPWGVRSSTVAATSTEAHGGSKSLLASGRTANYAGTQADLTSTLTEGTAYTFDAWVKLPNGAAGSTTIKLTANGMPSDGSDQTYDTVASGTADATGWVHLTGTWTRPAGLKTVVLYFEAADIAGATSSDPATHPDFLVDDVAITTTAPSDGGTTPDPCAPYPTADPAISSDFEGTGDDALDGWTSRDDGTGAATLSTVSGGHAGNALLVSGRTAQGQGPLQDVTCKLQPGQTYELTGWVRFADGQPTDEVDFSYANTVAGSTSYSQFGKFTTVTNTGWTKVDQKFTVPTYDALSIYFETKWHSSTDHSGDNTSDLLFDDLAIAKVTASVQDITPIKDTLPFPVGAAVSDPELVGAAGQLLAKHFDQVTPENTMKPEGWYTSDRKFVTTNADADQLMTFAQKNDMRVYGHNLVWYQQTPDWFFQKLDADGNVVTDASGNPVWLTNSADDQATMRDRLKTHIDNVAKYLSTKFGAFGSDTDPLVSFDVTNEVVSDNAGDPEGLRQSHWYQILGEEYIEDAFKDADQAFNHTYAAPGTDRPIQLFINDYNTEQAGKRGRLLDLVNRLITDKVPVDGVGHQFHVTMATSQSSLKDAIDAFNGIQTATGHQLAQAVTELDVPTGTPVTEANQIDQGYYYQGIFDMLRNEYAAGANIFSATVWGLTDGQSWRASSGAPLLFDDNLQAKPAYYGVTDQDLPAKQVSALVFQQGTSDVDATNANATSDVEWAKLPLLPAGNEAGFQLRWSSDHLTAYVSADDATVDATDAATFAYGSGQTATVKRDGTVTGTGVTAKVTSTATGWKAVVDLPVAGLKFGGSTQFDVQVTDGTTTSGWNTPGSTGSLQLVEPLSYTEIPEATTAPAIDGAVDPVWSEGSTVTTSKVISGAADGAKAVVHQLWKDDYLYVLADVTDATPDSSSPNAYERDSVEIFTDPGNAKNGSYRPDDMQLRIGANGDVSYGGGDTEAAQGARLTKAVSTTDHGYIVEARIDLKDGNTGVGAFEGVDYEVNDGTAGARTSNAGWGEQTGAAYQTTARWGVAQLVSPAAPPVDTTVAPAVTAQPASATVTEGQTATFTAAASGTPAPTVQWQSRAKGASSWTPVAGATSGTLKVTAKLADNGTQYQAVFTNTKGSATSTAATLTVKAAAPATVKPSVTTQPKSASVALGSKATFTAKASGTPAPSVKWESKAKGAKSWTAVKGATSTSLTVTASASTDGTQYHAVFTNTKGSATSSAATLTVKASKPVVTSQPKSVSASLGGTALFSAKASGYPTPKVEWLVSPDGRRWYDTEVNASTLAVLATADTDGLRFRAAFYNAAGTTYSSTVTLTIKHAKPVVKTQPKSVSAAIGSTVKLTAKASGYPAPSVSWQRELAGSKKWTTVSGARSTTLSVKVSAGVKGAKYRAVFKNSAGTATSKTATLSLKAAKPVITKQPSSVTARSGHDTTFHVTAAGYPTVRYQWYVQDKGSKVWVHALRGTSSTLHVTATQHRSGLKVRVVVSSSKGSVTSHTATLTVRH